MKKILIFITVILTASILTGLSNQDNKQSSDAKNNSAITVSENKKTTGFKSIDLFTFESNSVSNDNAASFLSKASFLKINHGDVVNLLSKGDQNILFKIPVSENNFVELELTRTEPVSSDFLLTSKNAINNNTVRNYKPGLHYRGVIKGKKNSIASVSIFNNFVMGIISDENGNYVLGSIKNPDKTYSDNYVFYNDADLKILNDFKCGNQNNEEKFIRALDESTKNQNRNSNPNNIARLPVKVYFEADYQMWQDALENEEDLVNFIVGMFNSVITIYQNESIPFEITQISYWTSLDPYAGSDDSYQILLNFGANTGDNYSANLAHLISTRDAGLGGIAWIRVMCAEYNPSDSSGRFAFSNIESGYNNYPTYSWTVNVVAHEMGHSLGSRHTQSCVWPVVPGGPPQAIDSCYFSEGGCFLNSQRRPTVGTIMSYCHLWPVNEGGGVNLASGFGPLPGDTIRLRYAQAGCLDRVLNSSEQPVQFDLDQNFPNPFNPVTKIRFAIPVNSNINLKVYDVGGRLITNLISNKFYEAGFYDVDMNGSDYNLSSGIYFYSLESNGKLIDTKRMVLIK